MNLYNSGFNSAASFHPHLAEIELVNLQSHGLYLGEEMYRCVIRTKREKVLLSNMHFRGLARIEGRDQDYRQQAKRASYHSPA